MYKSGSQTALKIISIITIVGAVLSILSSACIFVDVGNSAVSSVARQLIHGSLFVPLVGGIIDLIVGILGVRGANDPAKIGPFRIIAIIGLVIAVLGLVSNFFDGGGATSFGSSIIQTVFMALCVHFANNIKKQQYR